MPPEKRLRLNNQEGVPPSPNGLCRKNQQESIRFRVDRSFDLLQEDDELVPEEGILGSQLRFLASKICSSSGQL
jgi:hypothetical protein